MEKSKKFIALCKKHDVDPAGIPEITSFEEACKATGINPEKLPIVNDISARHQKRIVADYKLSIIADALRGMEIVDYKNSDRKYFAVFWVTPNKKKPSGFGLSFTVYVSWHSASGVGVRLCFPTYDMAEYFCKQFLDLHEDHHLLT